MGIEGNTLDVPRAALDVLLRAPDSNRHSQFRLIHSLIDPEHSDARDRVVCASAFFGILDRIGSITVVAWACPTHMDIWHKDNTQSLGRPSLLEQLRKKFQKKKPSGRAVSKFFKTD